MSQSPKISSPSHSSSLAPEEIIINGEDKSGEGEEKKADSPYGRVPYSACRIDKSHYTNFTTEINEICQRYSGICPLSESALDALDEVCRFWVTQLFSRASSSQDAQPKTPDNALQPRSFGAFLAPAQLLRMESLMDFFYKKSLLSVCPPPGEPMGSASCGGENAGTLLDSAVWEESVRRAVSEHGEEPVLMDREILKARIALEKDGRLRRRVDPNEVRIVSFVRPVAKRYRKFREWAGVDGLGYRVGKTLCEIAAQLLMEWLDRIAHGAREEARAKGLGNDEPLLGAHIKEHVISLGPNWICPPPLFV